MTASAERSRCQMAPALHGHRGLCLGIKIYYMYRGAHLYQKLDVVQYDPERRTRRYKRAVPPKDLAS